MSESNATPTGEVNTEHDFGEKIKMKYGSIPMLKIAVEALSELLIKKRIATTEELRETYKQTAARAEDLMSNKE